MFYSSHISQFMPMSINANVPKILENAPAQVLTKLHHFVEACNFIKKRLQSRCFPENSEYCEMFMGSFFIEHLRWLLLNIITNKTEFISLTR